MRIVDIPKNFNEDAYHIAMAKQVEVLSKVDGVKAIYQIGGLSTPGISDIDLVVVFEDGYKYKLNPRLSNDENANYLFTHGLYGASVKNFQECLKFTFFHNFRLLYGEDFNLKNTNTIPDQLALKEQIALEFLFKMYANLIVQKLYKTIKLRSLFLHIKALPYDFEFLNIEPKKLLGLVEDGVELRNDWFSGTVFKKDVLKWFTSFFREFELFLIGLFEDYKLYASFQKFKIAPNIEISNNINLCYSKKGLVFPDPFNFLDKRYFNVQNRFNDFKIEVPLSIEAPKIVKEYFKYANEVSDYNKSNLPYFMTLTSSLKVYK